MKLLRKYSKKVKILINEEADVNIPVRNVDRAHCVGPTKSKKQAVLVKVSTIRYRTLFYRAEKKIEH